MKGPIRRKPAAGVTSGDGPEFDNPRAQGSTMNIGDGAARPLPFRQSETFRVVPDRLWTHPRLQLFDIKLWCALSLLARGRGQCEATDSTLAGEAGASEQTVRRSLARLEREGFLAREMDGRTRVLTLRPEGSGEPIPAFALKIAR